jgi:ABC-2 type transport system permease protein/lipopolysaccharide transport system permease protein
MCPARFSEFGTELNNSSWDERLYIAEPDLPLIAKLSPFRILRSIRRDFRDLIRYRFVIHNLVSTQLKVRYHRSALGFAWTMLNPLLLLGVQAAAFSKVLNVGVRVYALYLFSGLVAWQWFSSGIESASRSLVSSEGMIRKVTAPKFIFPLSDILVQTVNFGFSMIALFMFFIIFQAPFLPQIVLLVPGTILLLMFMIGLGLITMTITTYFRDFEHIITVLLTALYFLSPILYPPRMVRDNAYFLVYNPMTYYLEFFHNALIEARVLNSDPTLAGGLWPSPQAWIITSTCSVLTLLAGYMLYRMKHNDYIYQL